MPEFPERFTDLPRAVATDDYLMVDKYRATVADIGVALGSGPAVSWNGTDATQFGSANNVGTPVSPTLAYVAQDTSAANALRITVGNGTGAGEGAAWMLSDTLTWQSMRVAFGVSVDGSNPIGVGETMAGGVVIAADETQGSSISIIVSFDDTGAPTLIASGNSAYGTSDFLLTGTPATLNGANYVYVVLDITARLADAATYPPSGAPVMSARVTAYGLGDVDGNQAIIQCVSTDWAVAGAFDTDRVGVVGITTSGVTATTGVLISSLSVSVTP